MGQRECITGHVSLLQCPFFALFQHIGVDIGAYYACLTVSIDFLGVIEHSECDVPCAAGDVEDAHRLAAWLSAGVQGADEIVLPETVDAEGHSIVHNVIRGGDGGEHLGDCFGLNWQCQSLISFPQYARWGDNLATFPCLE